MLAQVVCVINECVDIVSNRADFTVNSQNTLIRTLNFLAIKPLFIIN
jgi:hypothetical protein